MGQPPHATGGPPVHETAAAGAPPHPARQSPPGLGGAVRPSWPFRGQFSGGGLLARALGGLSAGAPDLDPESGVGKRLRWPEMRERETPREAPETIVPETISQGCGWCGQSAWFRQRAAAWAGFKSYMSSGDLEYSPRIVGIYQCGGCENASLFVWWTASTGYGGWDTYLEDVWPTARAVKMNDLPDEVQADRLEAWNCFLNGEYRAGVLMTRTALQRAVRRLLAGPDGQLDEKDKGSLISELDLLLERQLITPQLRANADEVRLSGNDVAHPEDMGPVTQREAQDSLVFLDDFLETTLAVPARQRARQARRESNVDGTEGEP